jgi:hypothetical protein
MTRIHPKYAAAERFARDLSVDHARSVMPCFASVKVASASECRACQHHRLCLSESDWSNRVQLAEARIAAFEYLSTIREDIAPAPLMTAEFKYEPVQAPYNPAHLFRPIGSPMREETSRITADMVRASKQFQTRSTFVPWPDAFYMEIGKDRRGTADVEDRNKRHQIDWFRSGSEVAVMPNLARLREGRNPYDGETGTMANVAFVTADTLKSDTREFVPLEDLITAVRMRHSRWTTTHAAAVRDTTRDMALFGIVSLWKRGTTRFVRMEKVT